MATAYPTEASVTIDATGSIAESACALIDWIREDDGPIYVHVTMDNGTLWQVEIHIQDGEAVATDVSPL